MKPHQEKVQLLRCQCEHVSHFANQNADLTTSSPEGHAYGVDFAARHIEPVKTPFGTFAVCPACRETCLQMYEVSA